jgi:hypothetical protein
MYGMWLRDSLESSGNVLEVLRTREKLLKSFLSYRECSVLRSHRKGFRVTKYSLGYTGIVPMNLYKEKIESQSLSK